MSNLGILFWVTFLFVIVITLLLQSNFDDLITYNEAYSEFTKEEINKLLKDDLMQLYYNEYKIGAMSKEEFIKANRQFLNGENPLPNFKIKAIGHYKSKQEKRKTFKIPVKSTIRSFR